MQIKDYYLVRNGAVIKGPWGDKPQGIPGVEGIESDQELEDVVPLFEYVELSDCRREALQDMEDGEAFFEVLDAEDGPMLGILIKLSRADYGAVSLLYKAEEGMGVGIGGALEVNIEETVAIPVIEVELEALPDKDFSAMVNIAEVAEDGRLSVLKKALENGVLVIGIGSSKGLLDDEVFVDDEESAGILTDLIGEAIAMFENAPWTLEMEGDFEGDVWGGK